MRRTLKVRRTVAQFTISTTTRILPDSPRRDAGLYLQTNPDGAYANVGESERWLSNEVYRNQASSSANNPLGLDTSLLPDRRWTRSFRSTPPISIYAPQQAIIFPFPRHGLPQRSILDRLDDRKIRVFANREDKADLASTDADPQSRLFSLDA